MAIHSSTIAWKIPWTEEPGRNQGIELTSLMSPADSLPLAPSKPLSREHKANRPLALRSHPGEDLEDGCELCSHPQSPEYQAVSLNSLKAP